MNRRLQSQVKFLFLLLFQIFFASNCLAVDQLVDYTTKINKAKLEKDTLGIARGYYKLGIFYDKQENLEKSNQALLKALKYANSIKNPKAIGVITNYLAGNYSEQGLHEQVISLYTSAFNQMLLVGDSVSAADVMLNKGSEYVDMGKFRDALEVELEALDLRINSGDSSNIAIYYQQIGEVYKELEMPDKWKEYVLLAKKLSETKKYATIQTIVTVLNDWGGILQKEKFYEKALNTYNTMLEISIDNEYLRGKSVALSNMVPVYQALNQNEKALRVAHQSYKIAVEEQNKYHLIARSNLLGNLYYKMNEIPKSLNWFKKALSMSGIQDFTNEYLQALQGLYEIEKKLRNYSSALNYLEQYKLVNDSLENIEIQNTVLELEAKYQSEKKENEIVNLNNLNLIQNNRLENQRIYIWGLIIFLLLTTLLIILFFRQQRLRVQNRTIDLEQKLLRSQMNPHFIFNTLGAIQSFMYNNDGKKAAFYLGRFSTLMRKILINSREEFITISEEEETIKSFLELHQLRLGFKFRIDCGDVDKNSLLLPPMLVQPFIENSVKHGIAELGEKGKISVSFQENKGWLNIQVEDNGVGIDTNKTNRNQTHTSYAISIFKERQQLLSKVYREQIDFLIQDKSTIEPGGSGVVVKVRLPVKI